MGHRKCTKKTKVLLVPYPAQGHVTPMLKLASLLYSNGLDPIVITPEFIHRNISTQIDPKSGISFMSIPDGLEEGTPRDFFAIENAMENYMPYHFEKLVRQYEFGGKEEDGIVCVIVDLLASWAVKVANRCGIQVAGFWPVFLAAYNLLASIPDLLKAGIISETGCPLQNGPICLSNDHPTLSSEDLPWLIGNSTARISRFNFWTRTTERTRTLKWLLVNRSPGACHEVRNTTILGTQFDYEFQDYPQILPIGTHVTIKNASFWEEDSSCLDWLDMQTTNSVMYISFGSWVSPIGEAKA
uniref:UDP-glycosyltransferase 82A1-like n=1 Tax=Nicotiana tabacum TaxID=4097 RepID=A0A1S4B3J5_TOBAC